MSLNKEQIMDMKMKAQMSCTTFDTMRDFVVCACDELLKYTAKYEPCNIREEVSKYAQAMEKELKENDYKGGWGVCDFEFLLEKLEEEKDELLEVATSYDSVKYDARVAEKEKTELRERIRSEAADVGNIAMMIADVCKAL